MVERSAFFEAQVRAPSFDEINAIGNRAVISMLGSRTNPELV